eukprot:1094751-Prymnesium_polylepis.2
MALTHCTHPARNMAGTHMRVPCGCRQSMQSLSDDGPAAMLRPGCWQESQGRAACGRSSVRRDGMFACSVCYTGAPTQPAFPCDVGRV